MKHQLSVKANLTLALTPKMRQGLDMLQLNNIELQQLLAPLLINNPFLVKEDIIEDALPTTDNETVEMDWDDYTLAAYYDDEDRVMELVDPYSDDPKHALLWQLNAHIFSEKDIMVAMSIIDSLDEHGYLIASNEELHDVLVEYIPTITKHQIENVRHTIMDIEPYGIASRSLQEFLVHQIIRTTARSEMTDLAIELINKQISAIAHFDLKQLMAQTHRSKETLLEALSLIRQLRARPWSYDFDNQPITQPDLLLIKRSEKLQVVLNHQTLPKVYFDANYYNAIASNLADKQFFLAAYKEAQEIIGNLSKRNQTLLNIAQVIVDYQGEYLKDANTMKPLGLHYLSEQTGLHVSTISRAIKNKTLATSHGVLLLKNLLSQSVASQPNISTNSVQEKIQDLIARENILNPMSDQEIADALKTRFALNIARRTIAKYRTQLGILPATLRRHKG